MSITMNRTIVDDGKFLPAVNNAFFCKTKQRKYSLRQLRSMTIFIAAAIVWLNCFRLWMFMYSSNNNISQSPGIDGDGAVSTIISSLEKTRTFTPTPPLTPLKSNNAAAIALPPKREDKSAAVRFLFVIGLEGTGHHLLQNMATYSPAIDQLREMHIYPQMTKRLGKLLYGDPLPPPEPSGHHIGSVATPPSLWGSMDSCAAGGNGATFESHQHDHRGGGTPSVEESMIELLKVIERKARSAQEEEGNDQQDQRMVTIPFNVLRTLYTMASYPHLQGPCRGLKYPDLDVWYHVCERAGVKCEHVYIHRDPYEILYSTNVNRKNNRNKTPLYVIHLYKSMLSIIYAQLSAHSDRTVGCYGMFERGNVSQWKYQVGDLLGWTDKSAYDEFFANEYSPPKPNGNLTQYKREFAQPAFVSAMQSLVILNDRVKQLCERTAKAPAPVLTAHQMKY